MSLTEDFLHQNVLRVIGKPSGFKLCMPLHIKITAMIVRSSWERLLPQASAKVCPTIWDTSCPMSGILNCS